MLLGDRRVSIVGGKELGRICGLGCGVPTLSENPVADGETAPTRSFVLSWEMLGFTSGSFSSLHQNIQTRPRRSVGSHTPIAPLNGRSRRNGASTLFRSGFSK